MAYVPTLKTQYKEQIVPALMKAPYTAGYRCGGEIRQKGCGYGQKHA